eukprot:COSAG01_NODE_19951_length_980_cov_1.164586_2_plen_55_part_00
MVVDLARCHGMHAEDTKTEWLMDTLSHKLVGCIAAQAAAFRCGGLCVLFGGRFD